VDIDTLDRSLLVGALVLVTAILAVRISVRVGLPSLLAYLGLGVLLGEQFLGIQFDDARLASALGFAALAVILAEGGLTTRWPVMRPHLALGISLATVGVAVSIAVVAAFGHYLLGMDWRLAFLLGAVFAPTDAAAVFSTLRRVPLRPRLSGALEAESGLNDAPTVVLVVLLSSGEMAGSSAVQVAALVAYELAAGIGIGLGVGWAGAQVLRRVALPASGLYPLAVLSFAVLAYGSAAALHASGFAAIYLAALVLGNSELPHRPATRSFVEGLAWLAQIGLFVMLGLLAWPDRLGSVVLVALAVGVVLLLVARPLSVLAAGLPFRLSRAEYAFLSWAGLRGAIPVVLATIPLASEVPGATRLFDLVFVVVLVFTAVQAMPLAWLARWLGVGATDPSRDLEVEAAPLERLHADLLEVRVPPASRLHGVEVGELRLPPGASVALVVREGNSFVPGPGTALRHGDVLLVVVPRRQRVQTERRLRDVSRGGRLAGWRAPRPSSG
jgi:cell volume regulation protein A